MNDKPKYFGTDGIRGAVGTYPITPDFMLKLGWALGKVLGGKRRSKVVIGKDTRISGYMFESALESGLSAAGVDSLLLGPMPTPGVAYLTSTFKAQAGIVISASHNPYFDNGIKFFSSEGMKLPDSFEMAIEAQLEKPLTMVANNRLGKATRINDAAGRYIEFCKSTIANSINLGGIKIVLDCANGANYLIAPAVFRELGADVIELNVKPDGLNINEKCGATDLTGLQQSVKTHNAQLGIAFDGDGDRVIMVDHQGAIVDGDELLFIIVKHAYAQGQLKGGVVGTLMTNYGMELALNALNIPFVRANVGDRFVLEELCQRGWVFGGESSGHILCLEKTSTGAGIVSALQVLAAMIESNEDLATLKQHMQKLPQVMINVKVANKSCVKDSTVIAAIEMAEKKLAKKGRLLLRPSGTEPVVRVMVEGTDEALIQIIAQELADIIGATAS